MSAAEGGRRVRAIALNTFREAVRDKILYSLLFFAVGMIAASVGVAELAVGEYEKIIRDLGLAAINLFGVAIAVFVGIQLVYKEIERKTIYTIASKPVPRWQFLLGKYLGLAATLATELLVMTAAFGATLWIVGASLGVPSLLAIWLTFVEVLVVIAVALFFSCFSSPTLSALFSVGLVVVGRLTPALLEIAERNDIAAVRALGRALYRLLPDLATFNIRAEAAYGVLPEWEYVAYATGYGAAWAGFILVASSLVFRARDFK